MEGQRNNAPVLLLILLLAGLLRVIGLDFGLPRDLHPDEHYYREVVSSMVEREELDPRFYAYPGLPFHLLLGVHGLAHRTLHAVAPESTPETLTLWMRDFERVTLIHRGLAALCSLLSLLLLHRIARRLFDDATAWRAALLFAVAPLAVRNAHFGVIDSPATTAILLALAAGLRAQRSGSLGSFVLAAVAIGFAGALRYLPLVFTLPLFLLGSRGPRRSLRCALALGVPALVFLALCPYTLLSVNAFVEGVRAQSSQSLGAGPLPLLVSTWNLRFLRYGSGLGNAVLGAVGLVLMARRSALPLSYALCWLGLLATGTRVFARYLDPVIPLLCLGAAFVLARPARRHPIPSALIFLLTLAPALTRSLETDRILAAPDSHALAQAELERPSHRSASLVVTTERLAMRLRDVSLSRGRWDPPRLSRDPSTLVAIAQHPRPEFFPAAPLEKALGARDLVFEVVAADEDPDRVFDPFDHTTLPLAGFAGVKRLGPSLRFFRLRPQKMAPGRPPSDPPRALSASRGVDGLTLSWAPPRSGSLAAYRLELRGPLQQGAAAPRFHESYPPDRSELVVPLALPSGTYAVRIAASNGAGDGPWSWPLSVTVR